MKYYILDPGAPGEFGRNTIEMGDKSSRPPHVAKLHYEFNHWPSDALVTYLCMFIATDKLRSALEKMNPPVTGIVFDTVEISGSKQEFERVWRKGRSDSELGVWYWFKITGKPFTDDFAYIDTTELLVSERVLNTLLQFKNEYLEYTECAPRASVAISEKA